MAQDNLIFKIRTGSHMYGTNTPDSDIDHIGVCIPPKDFVLGTYKFEQYEERTNPSDSDKKNTKADSDLTIYSLQKYIKLLADNNPNILETVYAPEDCIVYCDDLGRDLLKSRGLFISKRAYYKFMGYAVAQKKKLLTKEPVGLRSRIVEKHGIDTKYAAHLIRLLLFGVELLRTGELKFPTEHRKYLVSIKNGEWPLSHIIDKATYLERWMEESFKTTSLPDTPNMEAINKLQISLIERHWSGRGLAWGTQKG